MYKVLRDIRPFGPTSLIKKGATVDQDVFELCITREDIEEKDFKEIKTKGKPKDEKEATGTEEPSEEEDEGEDGDEGKESPESPDEVVK